MYLLFSLVVVVLLKADKTEAIVYDFKGSNREIDRKR